MSKALTTPRRRRRSWASSGAGGLLMAVSFSLSCWTAFASATVALAALGVTAAVAAVVIRDVFFGGRS